MGFPIGDLFSIIKFLQASVQTYQLFENDQMATVSPMFTVVALGPVAC